MMFREMFLSTLSQCLLSFEHTIHKQNKRALAVAFTI